jgi:hypothetical protein
MDTDTPLPQACQNACDAAGAAIAWIAGTRQDAPRLDREGDALTLQLRRARNAVGRLGHAAGRPLAIGFFGESQVGKSYLVSVLAAGGEGRLETVLGADRLDFLAHINPVGHGKEATGLVTRFTCRPGAAPASHPIEVRLLSEADLLKILGNSYFRDFNQELVAHLPETAIAERLTELRARIRPVVAAAAGTGAAGTAAAGTGAAGTGAAAATGGLDADQVVDIMDYFLHHFRSSMAPYSRFWREAPELAPRLDGADRARLFALLWRDVPVFTDAYRKLQAALSRLGHAGTAFCHLSALVERTADGGFSKEKGIINVQTLWGLDEAKDGAASADTIALLPVGDDGAPGAEVRVSRPVLAALVAELRFVLADRPAAPFVETVDLLDFPGYRGRLAVASLDDVARQARSSSNAGPMAELFLRGKVACLFERYTADQEMNLLLLCVASSRQPEVAAVKDAVTAWVRQTQGATPEERRHRPPGLFFVITRFDEKVAPMASDTAENRRLLWSDLMKLALEKLGGEDWMADWNGRPFDNIFLTRKPRLRNALITLDADERESGFQPGQKERLDELRRFFLDDELVRRHIAEAPAAWDGAMAINDGGASRLVARLAGAADRTMKTGRIEELLADECRRIRDGVGSFHSGVGAQEEARKLDDFQTLLEGLNPDYLGGVLANLQPVPERLRALYFGAGERAETVAPSRAQRTRVDLSGLMGGGGGGGGGAGGGRPGGGAAPAASPRLRSGRAVDFAREVMRDWQGQLRQFPEDAALLASLGGLPRAAALFMVRELLTAAARSRLEERIVRAIEEAEANASVQWEAMVDRQVLTAAMVIGRFVDDLDITARPPGSRPRRPDGSATIFAEPPPAGTAPDLPDDETPNPFVVDWLLALRQVALDNVGHSEASEIPSHANQRLGEILKRLPQPATA